MSLIPDFGEVFANRRKRRSEMRHRREDARRLVKRIRDGAAQLREEAADPEQLLIDRGYGKEVEDGRIDAAEWGRHKLDAAAAAEAYADRLDGTLAAGTGTIPDDLYRQAEKVAEAAELGGILIDGSRLAKAGAERAWSREEAAVTLEHQVDEQAAIDGAGVFEHVAETRGGVRQVPFWRLSTAAAAASAARGDLDTRTQAGQMAERAAARLRAQTGGQPDPKAWRSVTGHVIEEAPAHQAREDRNVGFYDPAHLTGDPDEDLMVMTGGCPYLVQDYGVPDHYCAVDRSPDVADHPFCRGHAASIRIDRNRGGYVAPAGDVDEHKPVLTPQQADEVTTLRRGFEFENCGECDGGAEDHDFVIDPFGHVHAQCRGEHAPVPGNDPGQPPWPQPTRAAGDGTRCKGCGLPIESIGGVWVVMNTGTTADGLTLCPPDPDHPDPGLHEPAGDDGKAGDQAAAHQGPAAQNPNNGWMTSAAGTSMYLPTPPFGELVPPGDEDGGNGGDVGRCDGCGADPAYIEISYTDDGSPLGVERWLCRPCRKPRSPAVQRAQEEAQERTRRNMAKQAGARTPKRPRGKRALEAAIEREDAAEGIGELHADDRQTCHTHRQWIEDCVTKPGHANPVTKYNWCRVHNRPVRECKRCWTPNVGGTAEALAAMDPAHPPVGEADLDRALVGLPAPIDRYARDSVRTAESHGWRYPNADVAVAAALERLGWPGERWPGSHPYPECPHGLTVLALCRATHRASQPEAIGWRPATACAHGTEVDALCRGNCYPPYPTGGAAVADQDLDRVTADLPAAIAHHVRASVRDAERVGQRYPNAEAAVAAARERLRV